MKVLPVVILSLLLGVLAGAGMSWAYFGGPQPGFLPGSLEATESGSQENRPKVLVDQRYHDFGVVERDVTLRHVFRFTNIGRAPLTLKAGPTTCAKCTIAQLDKTEVAPGESAEVVIEYLTSYAKPKFQQLATVLTNDPDQRRIELNIFGTVTTKYSIVPSSIVLSKISTTETQLAELKVYSYLSDEVHLVGHSFSNAETASFFQVQSEVLPAKQWADAKAKSACRVELAVKSGLPLGPIRQTIRLELAMSGYEKPTLAEVLIEGTVVSDLSIVGPGWNADAGKLLLGTVKSSAGATRKLFVLVRGEHRHETTIEPIQVDPNWLKVTAGTPSELNDSVTQIPLSIEIPRGLPPAVYLGSKQGKFAEIVLGVKNLPQVDQVHMDVQFVIE